MKRGANRGGLHWSRSLRFRLLAVTVAGLTVAVEYQFIQDVKGGSLQVC